MKLVQDKIHLSYGETLKIDEINIVNDKSSKIVGSICSQEEFKYEEKENLLRRTWRIRFLIFSFLLFIIFIIMNPLSAEFFGKLKHYITELLWCSSSAALGIYCALHNSRFNNDKRSKEKEHYWTYFVFVFFIATITSFVILGSFDKSIDKIYVYAAAALAGVIIGFSGDKLGEKISIIK